MLSITRILLGLLMSVASLVTGDSTTAALAAEGSGVTAVETRRTTDSLIAVANQTADKAPSSSRQDDNRKRQRHGTGPASGAEGLALAKQHLRELIPVLDHLRDHSPEQYEKALRDLDRAAKRLESIRRRDPRLYEISLREWQARGQIDLLKAKLRVKKSAASQQEMLQHLHALRDAEVQRIERQLELIDEREAAYKERIGQLSGFIQRGAVLREQLIEQRQRLEAEPINKESNVYLKAIGAQKSGSARAASSLKPKSKKATNE